jgi:glutamate racemase
VLDSGVGGLTILREIQRLLPQYPTLYFADQGHLPYGPRPPEQIRCFVTAIAEFLIAQGATTVVLACNAASAASLLELRERHPEIAFVGMEPAVKPAAEATRSGVIGVLTTQATADGPLYARVLRQYASGKRVLTQVAPELVQMVEQGTQGEPASRQVVARYADALREAGADQLVLACTHFPFLIETLREIIGPGVQIVDPSPAVARQVARVVDQPAPSEQFASRYYTSADAGRLRAMLKSLIAVEAEVETVNWQERAGHPCGTLMTD